MEYFFFHHQKVRFFEMWFFIIFILSGVFNNLGLNTQEISCCSLATGSCRNVCSKISIVALGADAVARQNASQRFTKYCPDKFTQFWTCINTTLSKASKHENWVGRSCCHLIIHPVCQSKCALASSRAQLTGPTSHCRVSDEIEFFSCLEAREDGEKCCRSISNTTCRSICRDFFYKPSKNTTLKVYSSKGCFYHMPPCLKRVAESPYLEDRRQYLTCCREAPTASCLDACRQVLSTTVTVREVLDVLEDSCGPAEAHSPLWSCLMQSTAAQSPRVPLDIAKLACCSRAVSANCQNVCWRTFQADWAAGWSRLENECFTGSEIELRRCLEEAESPCEMGCTGLSYCTKFNERSTTLFRSCSTTADDAARWEADHWAHGGLIRGLGVPVRADPSCPADWLHAAACLLQLRPCEPRIHETQICRQDCLELMASCVDWTVITAPYTAAALCSKISPSRPELPCVSLRPFMEEPTELESNLLPDADVSTPCQHNPCPEGQLCVLQPHTINEPYVCQASCTLGDMSKLSVPVQSWVQVPRAEQHGCHRICQCTERGLEKCRALNCLNFNSCWVQNRFVVHQAIFYLDCNPCHCFEGEVMCSRKSCADYRPPALPCDCPPHYVPVCGRLGVTFASVCLAKCTGMSASEVEFGSCSARDPCADRPCARGERCLKRTRVCLSPIYKPCRQFECVREDCNEVSVGTGPVCDRDNVQYASACALVRARATLAYWGPCLRGCSLQGQVCGINGEVYAHECAAWADGALVDYLGPCVAVGLISDEAAPRCGEAVTCPPLNPPRCIGVTPPGACCPVCGGAARLFYSRKQFDRFYYMMDQEDKDVVTLAMLLAALGRQLSVAQCSLKGFVTPESDVFVIIRPTARQPSDLQLRACVAEMEKLVTRISQRSPKVSTEVPLGAIIRAELAHGFISAVSPGQSSIFSLICGLLIVIYVV